MESRLGQLLVESGVLDTQQVDRIVAQQQATGEPFGRLAGRLFGVVPQRCVEAWAWQ